MTAIQNDAVRRLVEGEWNFYGKEKAFSRDGTEYEVQCYSKERLMELAASIEKVLMAWGVVSLIEGCS